LIRAREVDGHVGTWRDNVELWIVNINPVNHPIESRKSESSMCLVLANGILAEINKIYKRSYFKTIMFAEVTKGILRKQKSTCQQSPGRYW